MKRILALLLALLLCFSLLACDREEDEDSKSDKKTAQTAGEEDREEESEEEQPEKEEEEEPDGPAPESEDCAPLLYKVTDGEGNVAWLFGSIHVGREDFYPLPDYVLDTFDNADSLAVEFDIVAFETDLKAQMAALQALIYLDGTTIVDHIPEDLYEDAVAIMEDAGVYNALLDYYVPVLWSSFIDSSQYEAIGADTELGIDLFLLKRAKKADKPILDVESPELQYGMMAGFSAELQILMLRESVESAKDPETAKETMQAMMDLWMSGDEDAFREYLESEEDVPEEEQALYEEYNKAMLTDRNEGMADFTEDALASGDEVFICVGAAHVVGKGALVELMTQRGYTVERVTE